MTGRASVSWILLATLTAGPSIACDRGQTSPPLDSADPDAETDPSKQHAAALAELADAMDPGPQVLMSEGLPSWLEDMIGLHGQISDEARKALIEETLDAFTGDRAAALLAQPGALLVLARSVALLEAAVTSEEASSEELVALQLLYAALDQPALAHDRSFFAQFLPAMVQAARTSGEAEHVEEIEVLSATVFERMQRAELLRRHLVAELLRRDPGHHQVPAVLTSVAENLGREHARLALRAVELARDIHPKPGPAQHLAVAHRCFRALELACGDEALQLAGAEPDQLDDAMRARVDAAAKTQAVAKTVLATRSATDLDGRLQHAQALSELGLHPEAKLVFESLLEDAPKDARVRTGLARIEIVTHLDIARTYALLEGDGDVELDHRDAEYYEITIALQVLHVFKQLIPQLMADTKQATDLLGGPLAQVRANVEAHEALGDDTAVVLHALLDVTERALPLVVNEDRDGQAKLLRQVLAEAVPLQGKVPDSPHAYILLMSAAELMPTQREAVAAASTLPPEGGPPSLRLRQAQALLNLAIRWQDPALLEGIPALLESMPEDDGTRAVSLCAANMYAVHGHLVGDRGSMRRAVDLYYGLSQQFQDANAVNNLGVLLWELGELEQARAAFEAALSMAGDEAPVARLNALALQPTTDADADAQLEALALDESTHHDLQRLAMRWLATRSEGRVRARWLKQREASLAEPSLLPAKVELPGRARALLIGQFSFDVGYSAAGMNLVADASSSPWLVVVPPAS